MDLIKKTEKVIKKPIPNARRIKRIALFPFSFFLSVSKEAITPPAIKNKNQSAKKAQARR